VGVYGLTQLLRETPLAINTVDPLVYVAVSIILLGSAAAAMLAPAWHASRADPVVALRHT
jgi:ABC-type lipoprotein release transport system permease subunit